MTPVLAVETPWHLGHYSPFGGSPRLLFGQMYEDSAIERRFFAGRRRVFCIASSGSTALALCDRHQVIACDINPVQLAYAKRRANGFPAELGQAERSMALARRFMPLIGWRKARLQHFLNLSSCAEQLSYWRSHFDTKRFRTAFDMMMTPQMLRRVYAPAFLACLPPHFGRVLRQRLERGFSTLPNAGNPYLRALFLGESNEERRPQNNPIEFVVGDAAAYLEACAPGSIDAFSISNILDGASEAYAHRLFAAVKSAASPNSVLIRRSFSEPTSPDAPNYASEDRALLWGVVEVRQV